jgi:hypothetical protein
LLASCQPPFAESSFDGLLTSDRCQKCLGPAAVGDADDLAVRNTLQILGQALLEFPNPDIHVSTLDLECGHVKPDAEAGGRMCW